MREVLGTNRLSAGLVNPGENAFRVPIATFGTPRRGSRGAGTGDVRGLDGFIFAIVLTLAALPFGEVYSLKTSLGIVNVFDFCCVVLLGAALLRALSHQRRFDLAPLLSLLICFAWGARTLFEPSTPLSLVARQIETMLPYTAAAALLWSRVVIPRDRLLFGLACAALISVVTALLFHLFAHDVLVRLVSEEYALNPGLRVRLYWRNDSLAFVALVALVSSARAPLYQRLVVFASFMFAALGLFLTMTRTTVLGFVICVALSILRARHSRLRGLVWALVLSVGAAWTMTMVFARNQEIADLFEARTATLPHALELLQQRQGAYEQYLEVWRDNLITGVGLGKSLIIVEGFSPYVTDISIATFALYFGLPGLVAFGWFIGVMFKRINAIDRFRNAELRRSLTVIVWATLVISLNQEMFGRNTFPIYLVCLLSCSGGGLRARVAGQSRRFRQMLTPLQQMGHLS